MSASAISSETMRRLAFIRLLHQQGIEQSRLPEPLSFACVLMFHDAIELFLMLTSEHLRFDPKGNNFVDKYFGSLQSNATNDPRAILAGRNGVKRITDLRNAFKHANAWPGLQGIEQSRADAATFFEQNTPKVFKINYADIGMADLVPQDEVRDLIKAAAAAEAACDRTTAMGLLDSAVKVLFRDYLVQEGDSPFAIGYEVDEPLLTDGEVWDVLGSEGVDAVLLDRLTRQITTVTEIAVAARDVLRVTMIGIDYHSYLKFQWRTPSTRTSIDGKRTLHYEGGYEPTAEDYAFGQQFVINTALRVADIVRQVTPPTMM
ncbi:hypothetical protein ACWEPN_09790 [Nonomuraea wenchangensis]